MDKLNLEELNNSLFQKFAPSEISNLAKIVGGVQCETCLPNGGSDQGTDTDFVCDDDDPPTGISYFSGSSSD